MGISIIVSSQVIAEYKCPDRSDIGKEIGQTVLTLLKQKLPIMKI